MHRVGIFVARNSAHEPGRCCAKRFNHPTASSPCKTCDTVRILFSTHAGFVLNFAIFCQLSPFRVLFVIKFANLQEREKDSIQNFEYL
jgi:hypothetical protein